MRHISLGTSSAYQAIRDTSPAWTLAPVDLSCLQMVFAQNSHHLSWAMDEQLEFVRQIAIRLKSAGIDYMMSMGARIGLGASTTRRARDIGDGLLVGLAIPRAMGGDTGT